MARPFWSGQIQISLVSFGVKLFPAVEAKSEIRFHQIDRKTGERVRHQKISAGDEAPVEKEDIVKGYEYSKGEYIQIEPEEIAHLRIPSRHTLEVQQFVKLEEVQPSFYEKPYFVVPESDSQVEAFAVVRKALAESGKVALGKIALSGREHVMAIAAPQDDSLPGLMGYTLRYAAEMRNPAEYFAGIRTPEIHAESLDLAKELIKRKTAPFDPKKFTDQYETAVREMVEAKLQHVPLPREQKPAPSGKVVDLMDALRRSVGSSAEKKPPVRATAARNKEKPAKHGVTVISHDRRRKTA